MKIPLRWILLVLVIIVVSCGWFAARSSRYAEAQFSAMGTPIRIKVTGPHAARLLQLAREEIERLDRLLSNFQLQSEISQLNQGKDLGLSPDTVKILSQAQDVTLLTNGAFDVRLGRPKGPIDLGAIGKGYAAEAARSLLKTAGAQNAIIDMRSSIAVLGPKTWRIGIQHPREKTKILGVVALGAGQSLATSGDYERGRHIIDPRTTQPAQLCRSVTIVGTDAAITDALATGVFVLGPKVGMTLIESLGGTEGLIVDKNGKVTFSSGFKLR